MIIEKRDFKIFWDMYKRKIIWIIVFISFVLIILFGTHLFLKSIGLGII